MAEMQGNNAIQAHFISDSHELVRVWTGLYEANADTEVVNDWVVHLPASYAQILPDDVLSWVWRKSIRTLPTSLSHESWKGRLPVDTHLHAIHLARVRANELGIASMRTFEKLAGERIYERLIFSSGDDFFTTKEVSQSDRYDFCYSRESSRICKASLIDADDYGSENDPFHPHALRYVLSKWATGSWKTYKEEAKKLVHYSAKLIEELFRKRHRGGTLGMLEYYQDNVFTEWVPGTDFIPDDLREAVEETLQESSNGAGLANGSFIRNFYPTASEVILQHLHNKLSKRAVEKKDSCTLL